MKRCGADLPASTWARAWASRDGCQNRARYTVRTSTGQVIATPCGIHVRGYRRFTDCTITEEVNP